MDVEGGQMNERGSPDVTAFSTPQKPPNSFTVQRNTPPLSSGKSSSIHSHLNTSFQPTPPSATQHTFSFYNPSHSPQLRVPSILSFLFHLFCSSTTNYHKTFQTLKLTPSVHIRWTWPILRYFFKHREKTFQTRSALAEGKQDWYLQKKKIMTKRASFEKCLNSHWWK